MAIEQKDLTQEMINASITPLKTNDGYRTMCKAHCLGAENLQSAINYLSDCLDVDKANGVWLDYIGWLVGTTREYFDMSRYFCVNSADVNVEKEFYFPNSSQWSKSSLQDIVFRQKIKAKIGYNTSKGNRENNLSIIKGITNAEKVVITHAKDEYNNIILMTLDVHLYGDDIIYGSINSLRNDIENVFGVTVGLNNLEIN